MPAGARSTTKKTATKPRARTGDRALRAVPPDDKRGPTVGKDERRKDILQAAVRVFADKGYHGCRISDVAEEAGVAYGLVYHYFGNKDALLRTIFEKNWQVFLKAVGQIADGNDPSREKVRQVIDFLLGVYEASPLTVKVFILEFGRSSRLGDALETPEMGQVFKLLTRIFEEAAQKGELKDGIDPRSSTVVFLGAVESALAAFVLPVGGRAWAKGELDLERTRQSLHRLFTDGMFVEPSSSSRAGATHSTHKRGR